MAASIANYAKANRSQPVGKEGCSNGKASGVALLGPWADVILDPDFNMPFVVLGSLIEINSVGLANALKAGTDASGTVWQSAGQGLIQVGEGNYVEGDLAIITQYPLDTGGRERGEDSVYYGGKLYTVTNAQTYDFGDQFTQAVCKLATLNPSQTGQQSSGGFLG
jgi:hypothetical protein